MSAYIVSEHHLDLLITAALEWGYAQAEKADEIGRMLWLENLASYDVRYNEPPDREWVQGYVFDTYPGRMDPAVVATACRSLAYQCCEHSGWGASEARTWVDGLGQLAVSKIEEFEQRYGPVNPKLQAPGVHDWHTTRYEDGRVEVSGGGWSVEDRGVLQRTEALRGVTA